MSLLFPPSGLVTTYRGSSYRAFSPRIWSRLQQIALATPNGDDGLYVIGSDLRAFGPTTALSSTTGRYASDGGIVYLSYQDTSDTIAQIATDRNGAVTLTTAATDNNQSVLVAGSGAASVMALISDTAGDDKPCAFECRFKIGVLAETAAFIGLSEEGLAADSTLIDDTGALASKDFIGFHIPAHASVATCSAVYRKAGQAATTSISGLKTMVADTYYNMGFVYDPGKPTANRITWYLDNAEQTTYVTGTQIAAATFPDGEELQPIFTVKAGEASAKTLTLDSWFFGQLG